MRDTIAFILEDIEEEARQILMGATDGNPYDKQVDELLRTLEKRPLTADEVQRLKLLVYCMRAQEGRAKIMSALHFSKAVSEELFQSNADREKEFLMDGIHFMEQLEERTLGIDVS